MDRTSQYILLFFAAVLASCSTSRNLNIERGTGYNFRAGHPEFRTSAFGFVDEENKTMLEITAEIVKGSLIYKEENDTLQAHISIEYQVQDLENSNNILVSNQLEQTVKSTDEAVTSTREALDLSFTHAVEPSRYRVLVSITDLNTNKNITQSVETAIPETQQGEYNLSNIQMFGKINGKEGWEPMSTYDVKGKVDSLQFVFQVISPRSDKRMQIRSRLIQFESDTSYPRPMHYANYSPSSIEYKGIDYDEETELQSSQRILTDYSSTYIEYRFANPGRGNYRFEVNAQRGEEEELFKARDFGVKSKNYPAVGSARELARPLIYLMGEGDHEDLMAITDPDSLKKEVDRFWLKNIGNTNEARQVIEMYYQRVEEANKQFSNFKEGWKTDLGMIYVMFGAPWYTEDHLKELIWYYSYNHSDPEYSYYFNQPKLKNRYFPFYHFILRRSNYYYTVQYQQRRLWLSGRILTRQI
ncbi:GWxTD domain-containing protein [Fodinibius sediminis]|uniref:GWxTD domain-containing protein n=1 Tax=Fodinibius sediminis TaxID=1214077 RepID=A0A521F4N2_9BACT|nr:GWxTD domain-containing protein [Fodinibius sediminis]SMO91109.1 GWxTD domain-containing protein [Fodinibius sediminis]